MIQKGIDVCLYLDELMLNVVLLNQNSSAAAPLQFHLVEKSLNLCFGTMTLQANEGGTATTWRPTFRGQLSTENCLIMRGDLFNLAKQASVVERSMIQDIFEDTDDVFNKKDAFECRFSLRKVQLSKDKFVSGLECVNDCEGLNLPENNEETVCEEMVCEMEEPLVYTELKTAKALEQLNTNQRSMADDTNQKSEDASSPQVAIAGNDGTEEDHCVEDWEVQNCCVSAFSKYPVISDTFPKNLNSIHDYPITFISVSMNGAPPPQEEEPKKPSGPPVDLNNNLSKSGFSVASPVNRTRSPRSARKVAEDPVPCEACDFVALGKRGWRAHQQYHKGLTLAHRCRKCSFETNSWDELAIHYKCHDPSSKSGFVCCVCSTFKTADFNAMLLHLRGLHRLF